jgi:predicted AlkP superfamily phosphohydrolase/phosphomutase
MGARVLVVGLDGADADLVDRWGEAGRLPTLAGLRARGARGTIDAFLGLSDDAHWSSFSTGLTPGRHGRFFHDRLGPDGYTRMGHVRADMTVEPFWDALTRDGHRVAIIDVPKSPLGDGDSLVIADWMTHGADTDDAVVSRNASARGLEARFVVDPSFVCDADLHLRTRTAAANLAFAEQLEERSARRARESRDLLLSDDWDLFVTVFAETHCVGHQCWRDHDLDHPEHDADRARATGDLIERIYADVDGNLADLIDAAGPEATVVVFSPIGMGPNYSGTHLMDEVLARLEPSPAPSDRVVRAIAPLRRVIPGRIRRAAPRAVRDAGNSIELQTKARRVYRAFPFDLAATAIRISCTGRDQFGQLDRDEYLAARGELRDELLQLVDPHTGASLVTDVLVTEDVYPGPASGDLFDLIVIWDQRRPITGVRSDRVGVVHTPLPPQRSGNHPNGGGWFVMAGPGIEPAVLDATSVVDLAPTIASLLGTELTNLDGRVIRELVDPGADAEIS